jgi:hypothetical protein
MTVNELINLLESMPADVEIVMPMPDFTSDGHTDISAVSYDASRDAVILLPE